MHVALVVASSLDGKIAPALGGGVAFTSRADRARLFRQRDLADAVLCGAATLRAEDPPLLPTAARRAERVAAGRRPNPVRVVLSRSLDLPAAGRALRPEPEAPVVVLTTGAAPAERAAALEARGASVLRLGAGDVDLEAALARLERDHGVARLACEGGGEVNAAMLAADLVDEVHLTLCPVVIGGRDAPTPVAGPGGPADAIRRARLTEHRRVGDELFVVYALR